MAQSRQSTGQVRVTWAGVVGSRVGQAVRLAGGGGRPGCQAAAGAWISDCGKVRIRGGAGEGNS